MDIPVDPEFLGHVPLPAGTGPTARRQAVDLSREAGRASGTYPAWDGTVFESQTCSCGGLIVAANPSANQIRLAVQEHQRTPEHRKWRKREGL